MHRGLHSQVGHRPSVQRPGAFPDRVSRGGATSRLKRARAVAKKIRTMTQRGRAAKPRNRSVLVVAVGASAGGLEAVRKLLATLPANTGMAFVLIQHLDP